MSWSKCVIKVAKTGTADALGSPLVSIGTIKDKSTVMATAEGEKLTMKATGGFTIAQETSDGEMTLTTRIVESDFKTISQMMNTNVVSYAGSLSNATTLHIAKGSNAFIGMYLSDGTHIAPVTDIDKTNGSYDNLTITLGAATTTGDILFECDVNGNLLLKSNIIPENWSVEITPKNIGATGVRIRKTSVAYKEGYSEDEGAYADITFSVLQCADLELYTKFKKTA
jgi:hypothetical protein